MARSMTEKEMEALSEALVQGRKIEAVKLYRDYTGLGLKDAKDSVEMIEASMRAKFPERFQTRTHATSVVATVTILLCLAAFVLILWLVKK